MSITYKAAGVDIDAGDETVRRIKPLVRSTFNENVMTDIGLFGGFFDAKFDGYEHPILVASTDGVGTKLKIAFMTGIHNTVGQDLVNHCVDDILACGAKPLFFLDYFATGRLEPDVAEQIITGFVQACRENGCALIGGETAEMPSLYQEGEYDMSGTIVGLVEKSKITDGKTIAPGDIMIGLKSSGLHTNGYSLARAALFPKYKPDQFIDDLQETVGEALLKVHVSYLHTVMPMIDQKLVKGISHITGGGIVGNTSRILPKGTAMDINWDAWELPPIFRLIQKEGGVEDEEMRRAFNMGIGMILVTGKENADKVLEMSRDRNPVIMGEIVSDK